MYELDVMPAVRPPSADLRFTKVRQRSSEVDERPVIAESLPILVGGVASCRGCPAYAPNQVSAICTRMACEPPCRPDLTKFEDFVREWCSRNLRPLNCDEVPTTFDWIDGTPYTMARKSQLKEIWTDYLDVEHMDAFRTRVKTFVKDEGYDVYKNVRMINSREDYFKVYSGPIFDAIAEKVFSMPWFIKTVPVQERPKLIMDTLYADGRTYFMTDYTSMESHYTRKVFEACENVLYRYMVRDLPGPRMVVENIVNVLSGTNHITTKLLDFRVDARRMSGEMNTSLGNGFTNLMLFLYACQECDAGNVSGFVEGDDGIFVLTRPNNAPTLEFFEKLGWRIKITTTKHLNQASFCGNVFAPEDLVVVTDISKHLRNFGWCPKRYVGSSRAVKLQLLKAKGYSLAHQFRGCPVLARLGHKLVELTGDIKIRESIYNSMDLYHREMHKKYYTDGLPVYLDPPIHTRMLVEELYGVSIEMQRATEAFIDRLKFDDVWKGTLVLNIPILQPTDCYDYWDRYVSIAGAPWEAPRPKSAEGRQLRVLQAFGKPIERFTRTYKS